jgi:C4-dicarboxylate transporter DctM subunit
MDPMLVGVLAFVVLFFLLLVVGLPIGAGMAIVGTVGFWYLVSGPATFSKIAVIPFDTITSYVLAMIPLFVLMATVISYSGFGQSLYEAASKWLGRLPGGLGDVLCSAPSIPAACWRCL